MNPIHHRFTSDIVFIAFFKISLTVNYFSLEKLLLVVLASIYHRFTCILIYAVPACIFISSLNFLSDLIRLYTDRFDSGDDCIIQIQIKVI